MNNLCAALGIAQLQKLETFIKRKNKIASVYMKLLGGLNGINFIEPIKECKSTWWLFNIIFDKRKSSKSIGEIQKILQKKQIESRRIWKPIHQTQPYRNTIIIGGETLIIFLKIH